MPVHRRHDACAGEPLALLFAALCAILYANWIAAIARFQPNVLFMDQWDFLHSLFYGGGWWDRFIHQHGPHRQGLGLVITAWILEATNVDVRYESVWIATLLPAATLLALRLKSKISGPLRSRDAWIPLFFLSLGQFETVTLTPNSSTKSCAFCMNGNCRSSRGTHAGVITSHGSRTIRSGVLLSTPAIAVVIENRRARTFPFQPTKEEPAAAAALVMAWGMPGNRKDRAATPGSRHP